MGEGKNWLIESYGLYRGSVNEFIDGLSANNLLESITQKIVPQIAARINHALNPESTALVGASMGGLASIYGVSKHPDFFNAALSFSPHWVIGGDELAVKMAESFPSPGRHKIWMSRGTKGLDAKYEDSQKLADKVIRSRGYVDGINFRTKVITDGAHSNATWQRNVPEAIDFWMKAGEK